MGATHLSELGARMLLELDEAYPGPAKASVNAKTGSNGSLLAQWWSNLRLQGIVHGELYDGGLTVTGRQALHCALATTGAAQPLTGASASKLMLGIMRRHFAQGADTR